MIQNDNKSSVGYQNKKAGKKGQRQKEEERWRDKLCKGERIRVRKKKETRPPLHRLPWRQSGWKAVAVLQAL